MVKKYDIRIKEQVTQEICVEKKSTGSVANGYSIPLKTVEKWITQFNKNSKAFDVAAISEQEKIKNRAIPLIYENEYISNGYTWPSTGIHDDSCFYHPHTIVNFP